jgi:Na+/glutamate symporter
MTQSQPEIRGFKYVFTAIGATYILLAGSMLVRGPVVLRDFAVPEHVTAEPVLGDFFLFFYQYMAFGGVLQVLFGRVTRGLRAQTLVACVYTAANLLAALRDLSTSDSHFGNHLYRGDATLFFVVVDLAIASAYGALAVAGLRRLRAEA